MCFGQVNFKIHILKFSMALQEKKNQGILSGYLLHITFSYPIKSFWRGGERIFLIMEAILVPFFVGIKPEFVPRDLRNHAYFLFLVTLGYSITTLYSKRLGKFWQNYFEAWNSLERVRAFFTYLRRK